VSEWGPTFGVLGWVIFALVIYILKCISDYMKWSDDVPSERQVSRVVPEAPEAWKRLCDEIGAELILEDPHSGGRGRHKYKVAAQAKKWIITLDLFMGGTEIVNGTGVLHSSWICTRITAPFVNEDGFWFTIYRRRALRKLSNKEDIEAGYPELDRNFIIKSNSVHKVRALLANPKIRELIQAQPYIDLKSSGRRHDVLHFQESNLIDDVQRLKSLFELFGEALNQLCHIGSASEEAPNVEV
jgi:hypothetical protein